MIPILVNINTTDQNKANAIQQGLQLLVNNTPVDTMVDVAQVLRANPGAISKKIAMVSNPIVRRLFK